MQAAIDRVMQTYRTIVNLRPDQELIVRDKVSSFLGEKSETDEQKLAIAGQRRARSTRSEKKTNGDAAS
jgi:hypothetical protein